MKGEPTPAWDHGTRGSSPFWLGEGRVPSENVATPELVAFGVGEPGFLQAGRGSAVGKPEQSTTAPPLRSFLVFHSRWDVLRLLQCGSRLKPFNWLKANQPTGSIYRAQLGVKRCSGICLLVGASGKGLGCSLTLEPVIIIYPDILVSQIAISVDEGVLNTRFASCWIILPVRSCLLWRDEPSSRAPPFLLGYQGYLTPSETPSTSGIRLDNIWHFDTFWPIHFLSTLIIQNLLDGWTCPQYPSHFSWLQYPLRFHTFSLHVGSLICSIGAIFINIYPILITYIL